MRLRCVVNSLRLCSPKATRSRKLQRDLCFHNLNGYDPRELRVQALDTKVLSRGISAKSAPTLAAITIRKSHPLEGFCQVAILLPYTTLGIFCVVFRRIYSTPDGRSQTHPCFHSHGVGSVRRTSHPSGSRPLDVSLRRQTSAPGSVAAPENPRFPAVSNRVQRPDSMAPSRVQL